MNAPEHVGSGALNIERGTMLHMEQMESFSKPPKPEHVIGEDFELEDFKDNLKLYTLLARLPESLRKEHMHRISHLADEEAEGYLFAVHERRDAAIRESVVSDETFEPYFEKHSKEIWHALETTVFEDKENVIGRGSTAFITRFNLEDISSDIPIPTDEIAIKYLVTPNPNTLSVSGEHDIIVEVEQMRRIEHAENLSVGPNSHIRVPHPYFYYQKGKIQCYGMELIDGINLERGASGDYSPELKAQLREALRNTDRDTLMKEIDLFFTTMHTICHHGDVKPANMMVSKEGTFYVIDFGQSKLMTSVRERDFITNEDWKEGEKRVAKESVRQFLDALFKEE